MAGRLGKLGESSTTQSSGGRLGRLKIDPVVAKQVETENKKKDLEAKYAKIDADLGVEKSKADIFNPIKILGDIGNAVKGAGKALFVDPAVTLKKQTETALKGGQTTVDKGAGLVNADLVKNQTDFIRSEQKKGTISKEKADAEVNKLTANSKKATEKLTKAETETGVKYNPSEGAFAAIDTISNLTGLGEIGKVIFKSAAKKLSESKGRDLVEDELKDLAVKTKASVPEKTTAEKVLESTDAPVITKTTPVLETATAPVETVRALRTPIKSKVGEDVSKLSRINPEIKVVNSSELNVGSDALGEIDQKTVDKYVNEIQSGKTIEPIIVQNKDGRLFVEDGKHRLEAAKELGIQNVPIIERGAKSDNILKENIKVEPKTDTVSGNARRIEARAVEKKLTDKFEGHAEYKSINMKEQADKSIELVSKDRQKAIDIIDGKSNPPDGLKAQSVHQALEEVAVKEGDINLLQKLARSHVNTELSESAQNLRIAAERDPASAVENIRQVRDARMKAAERRSKTTVKKEAATIRTQVKARTPVASKQTWADFVSELEC